MKDKKKKFGVQGSGVRCQGSDSLGGGGAAGGSHLTRRAVPPPNDAHHRFGD